MAHAASPRGERLQEPRLRKLVPKIRVMMSATIPAVGGPNPIAPRTVAPAELEAAFVVRVRVVVTPTEPGVALAGEKAAVHLLGSPVQLKDTGELNDPYWGVT